MKVLKWILIVVGVLVLAAFLGFQYMKSQTKKASPEEIVEYKKGDLEMSVFYCRPYKKDREIFGGLVPYNEVWRTGANEATTFTTNKDITFGHEPVKAGSYTLWTIPEKDRWTIILNSKMYGWGVNFDSKATREAEYDVVEVVRRVENNSAEPTEQFTISFADDATLQLAWDKTKISIPIQ